MVLATAEPVHLWPSAGLGVVAGGLIAARSFRPQPDGLHGARRLEAAPAVVTRVDEGAFV